MKMEEEGLQFLYLSEPDMLEAGVLDMKQCVKTIEDMFRLAGKGDYIMGGPKRDSHGIMLWYPDEPEFEGMPKAGPDRRYMVMPAYLGGRFHVTGQKWYGSNVENIKKGLPRSILMFSLNDADTGAPMAIMSANLLSAARTGAVPGVAAKYLKSATAENIAVIGCGVINHACIMAIAEGMGRVSKVYLYDINRDRALSFQQDMEKELNAEYVVCDTLEDVLKNADVISVATAGKVKVHITPEMLKPGALLTITGTADLPKEMYLKNRVAVDNWQMHLDYLEEGKMCDQGIEGIRDWTSSYDMLMLYEQGLLKEDNIVSLGEVVAGTALPRKNEEDKLLLVVGGLPIEDVAWGHDLYNNALEKGLGQKLKIWDKPHWH